MDMSKDGMPLKSNLMLPNLILNISKGIYFLTFIFTLITSNIIF